MSRRKPPKGDTYRSRVGSLETTIGHESLLTHELLHFGVGSCRLRFRVHIPRSVD